MSVTIETAVDKWRFTCPEGHHDWRVWNSVFCCETCKQRRDSGDDEFTSVYSKLIDQKTGEEVTRDELNFKMGRPPESL